MKSELVCLISSFIILTGLCANRSFANESTETKSIYKAYTPAVFQIEIVDKSSGAKASTGSGFFVSQKGWAITNYHVIASMVFEPEQYVARMVRKPPQEDLDLELVAVDIVHDLALVKLDQDVPLSLEFVSEEPKNGTQLFAMGNPHSLGLTVVESSYSGRVESSLFDYLHLTGSINSGMSGGPTINSEGKVVGINVASAGNQLGFLIPARFAKTLFDRGQHNRGQTKSFIENITEQIKQHQTQVMKRTFLTKTPTISFGDFEVIAQSGPAIRCWGDTSKKKDIPYITTDRICDSEFPVYVHNKFRSVRVKYGYTWVVNKGLDRLSFSKIYNAQITRKPGTSKGTSRDLTNYRCHKDFVKINDIDYLMGYCVRAYKELKGLYDIYVSSATLHSNESGLTSYIFLSGFTYEDGQEFARRIMEVTRWKK